MTEIPDNITERSTGTVPAPADDLYRHVNGAWLASHEIPADRAVDGKFHELRDRAELDVKAIVAGADPSTRIGALFSSYMDEDGEHGIEQAGLSVLSPDLDPVRDAPDLDGPDGLVAALAQLDRHGVGGVVGFWTEKDAGGSGLEVAYLVQTGLGLPDEAYYREEQHAEVRAEYRAFIERFLGLVEATGGQPLPGRFADADASTAADALMAFETALAAGHWDTVASRDAEKTHNPTAQDALPSGFPFAAWLDGVGITTDVAPEVIVSQPSYLEHVASLVPGADNGRDLDEWKLWAYWRVLTARAGKLPREFSEANFDFYGRTLSGSTEQRDRWKRAVMMVEGAVGEEVGQEFVAEHFPPEYKELMGELVDYLLAAYRDRISELPWMTPQTRERALEKLGTFRARVGYPDTWRDFSGLELGEHAGRGENLLANYRAASDFNHEFEVAKLGKPSDGDLWFTTPQTVNAFYNPVRNDITFPAAILRPPFFDADRDSADMAANFGAIGAVIGHEIGHGFDDQGSKYDGEGNLNSWWTEDDRAAFTELTDRLVTQYDGLVPTGLAQRGQTDHKVNGSFTLGENIGDLGGLGIAVVALKKWLADRGETVDSAPTAPVEGLDGEFSVLQRFFLQWATVWRTAIRPQMAAQYVAIDPHSPGEFRCNVVASNVAEFYEAFGVDADNGMWLPEEQRVTIW
ncbi:MAG: M13 family metallopeptidase [Corynebacterium sp.]|uniref:M13 family metallopeptidase n=1 Tax=unclassified Corynebacterium TaxID=2624378 RepID=UPI002647D344|nr:M13-type metalloendopeptidase [Corynebacterium sp.]MDN5581794.1 peptidase M13 [Corynebacterium sp.]MDN5720173.1 peptidase M13 [Corynebacterium sp.]MDN6324991.1 peptidase M13 [Corynebacterium sp.]MDN6511082.1 peptidase M13 [Corynebacterium sp.]